MADTTKLQSLTGYDPSKDTGLSKLESVAQDMATKGYTTAGQAFLYGQRPKQEYTFNQQQNLQPIPKKSIVASVGGWAGNIIKDTVKNTYTSLTNAGIIAGKFAQKEVFQLTHNGQDQFAYNGNNYMKLSDQYTKDKSQLVSDYKNGKINQTQYEQQLNDLEKNVGIPMKAAQDKYNALDKTYYQIRDWKTGNYRDVNPVGDAIDIANAAFTVGSLFTAGATKAVLADTATNNFTKFIGRDMILNGLEKIGSNNVPEAATLFSNIDNAVYKFVQKIPGLRDYTERQIAKIGGGLTAKKFVTNATAEILLHNPIRQMNIESSKEIVNSIRDGKFLQTPDGQSWLSSGAGQAFMLAGMALEGGPVGFALKSAGKLGKAAKVLTYGADSVTSGRLLEQFMQLYPEADQAFIDAAKRGNFMAEGTYTDHLFRMLSPTGDALEGWKFIANDPEKWLPVMKSLQETYATGKNSLAAAMASVSGLVRKLGPAGKELNIQNGLEDIYNWWKASEVVAAGKEALIKSGKIASGQEVVAVAFGRQHLEGLVNTVDTIAKDIQKGFKDAGQKVSKEALLQAQKDAMEEFIGQAANKGEYWAQHDNIVENIVNGIRDAKNVGEIKAAIKSIDTAKYISGLPPKLQKQLKELGYVVGLPKNISNPFIPAAQAADKQLQSILVGETRNGLAKTIGLTNKAPVEELSNVLGNDVALVAGSAPVFSSIGKVLDRIGIGLGDGNKMAYRLITTNAINAIDELNIGVRGSNAINKLQDYSQGVGKFGVRKALASTVSDLRQLTKGEISSILGVDKSAAEKTQQAIIKSHLATSLEVRGLADRLVDYANAVIPTQRLYSRVQGALRYTFNPFFRLQEVVETKLLSIAAADSKTSWMSVFGGNKAYLDDVVKKMESARLLDTTMYGEAAAETIATTSNKSIGKLSAKITGIQKRDLAMVVDATAQKYGVTVDELLANHTQDVMDLVRPIVQYPTQGAINSNLAKFANIAAFPSRYNLKVTNLVVKALANQTPMVQGAIMKGIFDFNAWLNSDSGLAWQQDYANEIKLFKWLTPYNSLEWTMKQLQGDRGSWSDFGQVGGLPFGVWGQILNDMGIIDTQTPYVDPKTGTIFSNKIPTTTKGRMALAIMDMLGSAFTYPGRTIGLPGKQSTIRDVANKITGASNADFATVYHSPEELTKQQQKAQAFWQERLKANGVTPPITPKPQQPVLYNGNIVVPNNYPLQKSTTKQEINALTQSSKQTAKKKKQPVDFNAILKR